MSENTTFLWVDDDVSAGAEQSSCSSPPRVAGLPAEPGLWLFVLADMTVFGAFFSVFVWESRSDRSGFSASAADLFQPIGVANTLVLLISSYVVVLALEAHRRDEVGTARALLLGALACGGLFAGLKVIEYSLELSAGHTPSSHLFFTLYYLLTGVHLLHVLIGMGLLLVWRGRARPGRDRENDRTVVEAAAVWWHMVDLLWLVIFALVYLAGVA